MALIFPNADTTTPVVTLSTNFVIVRITIIDDVMSLSISTACTGIVYGV